MYSSILNSLSVIVDYLGRSLANGRNIVKVSQFTLINKKELEDILNFKGVLVTHVHMVRYYTILHVCLDICVTDVCMNSVIP